MKTLVYHGPRQLSLEDKEDPHAGPGEAVIKVEAAGICGSELEGYLGHSSVRIPPLIMGHEFCGTIVGIDYQSGALAGFSIGDKVVANPLISCGSCDRCIIGKRNLCRHRELIGIHRPGAFAGYVTVPVSSLYKVPQEMDAAVASLAEPLAVCIHAIKLGLPYLDDLIIYGAGTIGLLTLQAALNMGANQVLVVDRQEVRLHHVKLLGAEVATPEQVEVKAAELFAQRGIDTIIDCVGATAVRQQALELISPGGNIVLVGLGSDESPMKLNHLVRQEVNIRGSYSYSDADFKHAVQMLVSGKIRADGWLAKRNLSDGPDSFRALVEGKTEFSKITLHP
ncbi:zinc-binding dehydrogenase [Paenibacillus qinlingensis]|uniref:2-desacetyl-2-hydroxyethyl bacteriochlorophyllide A dehydrogenase n=1 Tax=Paenibacillus qinlingensis TaxID=1837343 RepID=A0ABU1P0E3_9BACL|nr:alcohol dehydrogenase catalytic domain-containing protein [Paenibacillus qinlingensis]MDR6553196.1 2-desacetyl-2-hydroxyethyl bacteriochlorophyllide A dehydrogenase [Paenibacillus qinlingensis]